jgi:hypothetical protein
MMDSSFLDSALTSLTILTFVNLGLGLFSLVLFTKLIIQFGLPNHPARFTCYLAALCGCSYFVMQAGVDLRVLHFSEWQKLRVLPLVVGGLTLLLQTIMMVGSFSLIQQKVVSRMPLIAGLLCLAFFPSKADWFFIAGLTAGLLFLCFNRNEARHQRRIYIKMCLFILAFFLAKLINVYWVFTLGQALLGMAIFYFFQFQNAFGISALVDEFREAMDGGATR